MSHRRDGTRYEAFDCAALEGLGDGVSREVGGTSLEFWAEVWDKNAGGDVSAM